MADIQEKLGTATAMTITLASLADGSARQSAEVDNTSNLFFSAVVAVKIKTHATDTDANGNVKVYAYGNVNDVRDDSAGASDAAISVVNAVHLGTIVANVDATTYIKTFHLASVWPFGLPSKWGIIVYNDIGAALDSTGGNHSVTYQGIYAQSA
jgi:hypothetical protein